MAVTLPRDTQARRGWGLAAQPLLPAASPRSERTNKTIAFFTKLFWFFFINYHWGLSFCPVAHTSTSCTILMAQPNCHS